MTQLRLDVWSDIVCPWCWVGKRRLETALEQFAHRDAVEVVWRAFELDPGALAVRPAGENHAERLAKKYGMSRAQAEQSIKRLTDMGAIEGLDFRFDRVRSGNTFDGHRLIHLGRERGVQDAVKERLMRAYFTEGEPIGDRAALARLGVETGLDPVEVAELLHGDTYAAEVRADEKQAARLGIHGVPCFVLAGRYAVEGAQPAAVILGALEKAWAETAGDPAERAVTR